MNTKTCNECNIEKPITEFYPHKQMADGLLHKCKECTRARVMANRAKKIDYYRAYNRQYANTPERWKKTAEHGAAWTLRNPRKRAAQYLFNSRKRYNPDLATKPCERCGREDTHAHHENYDKPLEIVWLCPICHAQRHKEMKKEGIEP